MRKSQKPVQPIAEKKETTREDHVRFALYYLERPVKSASDCIESFRKGLDGSRKNRQGEWENVLKDVPPERMNHALADRLLDVIMWQAEDALVEGEVLMAMSPITETIAKRGSCDDVKWLTELKMVLENRAVVWQEELVGTSPRWWPCSTSVMSNVRSMCRAKASAMCLEAVNRALVNVREAEKLNFVPVEAQWKAPPEVAKVM
jgi:hypothetical protein